MESNPMPAISVRGFLYSLLCLLDQAAVARGQRLASKLLLMELDNLARDDGGTDILKLVQRLSAPEVRLKFDKGAHG